MRKYSVLLLDDEHLALQLLENFCQRLPDLEVKARFRSPEEALHFLQQEPVDILFSDIQMPVLSGVHVLQSLQRAPVTIFTTAYSEYAVEAYALNAVDYLVKPFAFERFLQAVGKARTMLHAGNAPAEPPLPPSYLVCKVDGRLEKIPFDEIQVVEGMREYVKIICNTRYYITLESMKNMEAMLPAEAFVRTHKSWIVAKRCVRSFDGNLLILDKLKIPVSRERKEAVVRAVF